MLSVQSYFIHVFVNTHSFKYKGCWDCLCFFCFFSVPIQMNSSYCCIVRIKLPCFYKATSWICIKKKPNLCLSWISRCISEASRLKWTIQLAPTCLCNGVIETWMALPTVFTQTRVQADVSCGDGCWASQNQNALRLWTHFSGHKNVMTRLTSRRLHSESKNGDWIKTEFTSNCVTGSCS